MIQNKRAAHTAHSPLGDSTVFEQYCDYSPGWPYGAYSTSSHTWWWYYTESAATATHRCLDQLHPLVPDPVDDACNIHLPLLSHLLQSLVYGDECTSSTHTSTERERESVCVFVGFGE